jgi:DNA mismatch repair protein MutL
LIDQHAAHERILYERLLGSGQSEARQALMFPVAAAVPRSLGHRLDETARHLEALGFLAEPFGQDTLLVRETPSSLGTVDLPALLADLLDQMAEESPLADVSGVLRREKLLATMACHAAIKVHTPLTGEKMNYLINELFRTRSPLKCPHGRPAVLRYSHETIERGFDRR